MAKPTLMILEGGPISDCFCFDRVRADAAARMWPKKDTDGW